MDSKSIFASKTFWANILGPLFLWLGTKYGVQLDTETQMEIIGGAMALVNIALRLVTKQPVHVAGPGASTGSTAKALLPVALAAALGFGLSACSNDQTALAVSGLEVGLTAAERLATGYESLPLCGATISKACSDPAVVQKIKAADNTAYTQVKTAQANLKAGLPVDLVAAQTAITVLQGLVPTSKQGN